MKKILIKAVSATMFMLFCAVSGMAAAQPEPRAAIDISNHPFTGPESAPVTVVVFSDYL